MMSSTLASKAPAVALAALAICGWTAALRAQTSVTVGIGTQDTTTNRARAGTIIRQLNLFEKSLPKDGKYANIKFQFEWNTFTSGPPVTNGMMANKLHFGMMGDYPLVVNGFTFQTNPESKSRLIAVAAYNRFGSGNGLPPPQPPPYPPPPPLPATPPTPPPPTATHPPALTPT